MTRRARARSPPGALRRALRHRRTRKYCRCAIVVALGGPATFWIPSAFGMSAKFTECIAGQAYRQKRADGRIMGGAMYYLSDGLAEM